MTTYLYGYPTLYSPAITANPQHPRQSPQPEPASEATFNAAILAGATHLAADGQTAYCTRYGKVLSADWLGRRFGAWQEDEGLMEMPAGAVKLE